jgi:hypothetical protein
MVEFALVAFLDLLVDLFPEPVESLVEAVAVRRARPLDLPASALESGSASKAYKTANDTAARTTNQMPMKGFFAADQVVSVTTIDFAPPNDPPARHSRSRHCIRLSRV